MTTLQIPYKRFVAQVSTGAPRIKSSYVALMEENLTALQSCPWREAGDVPVSLVPHDFTLGTFFSDAYDAFKMTGNYNSAKNTEVGYAGMAAYRFEVPASALGETEVALSALSLPISRDKFLLGGVHVGVAMSSDDQPSTDWSVIRGSGEFAKSGLSQADVPYLLAGDVGSETIVVDLSGVSTNPQPYLWVYLTLEDYTDYWTMYDKREQRLYAIEGSAMLVGGSSSVTFAGDVELDGDAVLLPGGSSPTWLQPPTTLNAGAIAPAAPDSVVVRETFFTAMMPGSAVTTPRQNVFLLENPNGTGQPPYLTITLLGNALWTVQIVQGSTVITKNAGDVGISGNSFAFNYTTSGTYHAIGSVGVLASENDETAAQVFISANIYGGTNLNVFYSLSPTAVRTFDVSGVSEYCIMLAFGSGAPVDADICDRQEKSSRRHESLTIAEVTPGASWTVTIGTVAYTVEFDSADSRVQLAIPGGDVLGEWATAWSPATGTLFDPAALILLEPLPLGLAASVGDFSSAVATFEAGTRPPHAELLGRLCRMAKTDAAGMMSAHPAACALSDELDVLRPVPRFFRTGSTPPVQTDCQPGLSAWYYRPTSGSTVAAATTWRDGSAVRVGKVTNPVFLQYASLAMRAPKAFASRLTLANNSGSSVANGFALRFVAWVSPASEWDMSDSFALAAMASMPSVYRSDGDEAVSWQVDCSGTLMPLGVRTVNARRLGASAVVSGDIADEQEIVIPISAAVNQDDVVFVAPEVVGFADGEGSGSVYFGRQANPATAASFGAWARYACDLGWFPTVTGS